MSDKSNIPQFTGASYKSWAFKCEYGLVEKKLHCIVMEFDGLAREPRPTPAEPLKQAALDALPDRAARVIVVANRE